MNFAIDLGRKLKNTAKVAGSAQKEVIFVRRISGGHQSFWANCKQSFAHLLIIFFDFLPEGCNTVWKSPRKMGKKWISVHTLWITFRSFVHIWEKLIKNSPKCVYNLYLSTVIHILIHMLCEKERSAQRERGTNGRFGRCVCRSLWKKGRRRRGIWLIATKAKGICPKNPTKRVAF